jgi:putative DNA primase/helicase
MADKDSMRDELVYLRLLKLTGGLAQFTDTTNAYRLFAEYGKEMRYNTDWKKWIVWVGNKWKSDSGALVHDRGLKMVRNIYRELLNTANLYERLEIEKHALKSESVRNRENFVKAATWIPELNITSEALDRDPWLFNVENGTLNLRDGALLEHKQENMITKIANVKYDADADCPTWKQFMREIMDYNSELLDFVQKAAGYAMTGDTSEQVAFILFGSGANGKSTFLNALSYIMGDYALSAQTETFMKQSGDRASNDIARLRSARFVTTAEADEGRRLSETLIKQLTGSDKLTARFLFAEYFDFKPSLKLFMATNHKPVIKGTDYGIWRRIRLLPFTTTMPPEKQDKNLEEKLRAEASGILNWLLEGVQKWLEKGLAPPNIVSDATDEYRAEMDVIGNFIKERCVQNPADSIKARELFKNYQDWCDDHNEHACNERFFGLRLKELKIEQKRLNDGRYWQGLTLKAQLA